MAITRQEFESEMAKLIKDYCDEAEHQDGDEYWDKFESVREAVDDWIIAFQYGPREYME